MIPSGDPSLQRPKQSPEDPPSPTEHSLQGTATYPPDTVRSEPELPAHLGRYRVEEEIARGGMGQVVRVHDQEFQRPLAMKVVLADGANRPDVTERFLREARLTGQLQHPGIPPVQEMGRLPDGRPYFIMKLVRGTSLKTLLQQRASPADDLPRFVAIFEQICQTLAFAHSQGVIHRDLKPANIMIGAFGEVQVMDWGLAKELRSADGSVGPASSLPTPSGRLEACPTAADPYPTVAPSRPAVDTPLGEISPTQSGTVMGTVAYMAPEQARGEIDNLDPRCDVFGLGGILCDILTGKPPFAGKQAENLMLAMSGELSSALVRLAPCGADAELVDLCKKCLAPKKDDRPPSASAVAQGVAQYQAELQRRLKQAEIDKAAADVKVHEERRRRRVTVALAASLLALILGGGGAALWYYNDQARQERDVFRKTEAARQALKRGTDIRAELHAILKKQGGVQKLLNKPTDWEAYIRTAKSELEASKGLALSTDEQLDPDLGRQIAELEALLDRDEKDRLLALRLEKIHTDWATIVEGEFDYATALQQYPKAFGEANLAALEGDVSSFATSIRSSPIQEQLVAALDDWALVSTAEGLLDVTEKLLHIARSASPDPVWGDRIRQLEVWRDAKALGALMKEAPVEKLSPQMLHLVGSLSVLETEHWLRQAQAQYPTDFWLNFALAGALRHTKPVEAEGFYRAAIVVRPRSTAAYLHLGSALHKQQRFPEAIAACEKAIALDSKNASAYNELGNSLREEKRLPKAIAAYEKAIAIEPKHVEAHNNLGLALADEARLPEAITAFEKAIVLRPQLATAHNNLGVAFYYQKRLPEAIAAYDKAIALDPKDPKAYVNLGVALYEQKRLPEAIAAYEKAITVDPKHVNAHGALGKALLIQGLFGEAVKATKTALNLLPANHGLRAMLERQLNQCQRMLTLEKRLHLVLAKKESGTALELAAMAGMCQQYKKQFALAVRLCQDAFKADPKLIENPGQGYRYNAACAAALASLGRGAEAARLTVQEKSQHREQARQWLEADLDWYAQQVKEGKADAALLAAERLRHWQTDPDLLGLREPKDLDKLPHEERQAWHNLWASVARVLNEANSRFSQIRLEGTLKEKSRVHEFKMTEGTTYVLDLESAAFDAFLIVEDATGKKLAEHDDIIPNVNTNSRLVFEAPKSGVYRIVATSFEQRGSGPYTLTICEFKESR